MNEPTLSDTASDSDFDEQDFTAEEDDESIAPDEDAADEEEIDSLVKESQMSLEELLASYGVSVPVSANEEAPATSGPAVSASRSGRLRATRRTGRRPISPVKEDASEQIKTESSSSAHVKRDRRFSASSSLDTLALRSVPFSVHTNGIENDNPSGSELRRIPPFDTPLPSSETSDIMIPDMTVPKQLNVRRITGLHSSANKQRTKPIEDPPNLSQQLAAAEVIQNPPSPCGSRSNSITLLTCPVDLEYDPRDCTSPDPPKDDGEESHDSGHDETYSTRFWKRAIVGGESPASYNSEDDEDYAPSVDSGNDWRGEIRIGEEYQALVPPYLSPRSRDESLLSWRTRRIESECSQLWQPGKLSEAEVVRFERLFAQAIAFPRPNDNTVDDEEALFLLMRCDYDPDEALQRLRFRTVLPSEIPGYMDTWSEEDSVAFEKGFVLYNKDFRQIRETKLRHKTVRELVHYYYLWKKSARHDEFSRIYRRDKRKSSHPSITDFMDCLMLEQQSMATDAYPSCHDPQDAPATPQHHCSNQKTVRLTVAAPFSESSSLGVTQSNPNHRQSSAGTGQDHIDKTSEPNRPADSTLSNSTSSRLDDTRTICIQPIDNQCSEATISDQMMSTQRLLRPAV